MILFEGRDAAGKDGVIKRITQRLNPRVCRVVALPAPNDRERTRSRLKPLLQGSCRNAGQVDPAPALACYFLGSSPPDQEMNFQLPPSLRRMSV